MKLRDKMVVKLFEMDLELKSNVLSENWLYFSYMDHVDYFIRNNEYVGVNIKLTSCDSDIVIYLDTKERLLTAIAGSEQVTYAANDYVCDKLNEIYEKNFYNNKKGEKYDL